MKIVTFRLEEEALERLHCLSKIQGRTTANLIRNIVNEYLTKENPRMSNSEKKAPKKKN